MTDTQAEHGVRDAIRKWDTAYRKLDAAVIAALETPDFELVDRFGNWFPQACREENERMWEWAFANIYQGRAGPEHRLERIRFVHPEVAIVQARAYWVDAIKLKDGTNIAPHGQITTFVVVKQRVGWQIAAQNVHNTVAGDGPAESVRDQLPWNTELP